MKKSICKSLLKLYYFLVACLIFEAKQRSDCILATPLYYVRKWHIKDCTFKAPHMLSYWVYIFLFSLQ